MNININLYVTKLQTFIVRQSETLYKTLLKPMNNAQRRYIAIVMQRYEKNLKYYYQIQGILQAFEYVQCKGRKIKE